MYAEERRPLPEGWALDQDGNPTTEAEAALLGSLLPLGEHKGYGLAMVSEILGAVLTGAGYGPASGAEGQVGHFLLVFDPGLLMPPAEFAQRIETISAGSRPPPGRLECRKSSILGNALRAWSKRPAHVARIGSLGPFGSRSEHWPKP